MGMFDEVIAPCPCGGVVQFQSKAGECSLRVYPAAEVPLEIAAEIHGTSGICDKCGTSYTIGVSFGLPKTVHMRIV